MKYLQRGQNGLIFWNVCSIIGPILYFILCKTVIRLSVCPVSHGFLSIWYADIDHSLASHVLGHHSVMEIRMRRPIWGYSVCLENFHRKIESSLKITRDAPKNENGLTQLIMMGESICQIWVN